MLVGEPIAPARGEWRQDVAGWRELAWSLCGVCVAPPHKESLLDEPEKSHDSLRVILFVGVIHRLHHRWSSSGLERRQHERQQYK